jgi:WD40 repeat protein
VGLALAISSLTLRLFSLSAPAPEEALLPIKLIHEKHEPLKGIVPRGSIESLVYRPDGKTLALGDSAGQVILWSNGKAKVEAILTVESTGNICGLAFSPDGKTLAAGGKMLRRPNVRIWDIATSKAVADLKGPNYTANHVAISPDGKWLAAGGTTGYLGEEADQYEVIVWALATRKQHAVLVGHPGRLGIGDLAFAPDSATLAVSCGDGSVRLWKVSTAKEIATIANVGGGLAFAPDGKTLFGQAENEITVTDVAESKIRARWKFPGTQVKAMALSKDGRLLAVAGYRRVEENVGFRHVPVGKIWDAVTGKELADLGKDFLFLSALAFAPDGKTLAGTENDMMLHLWKLERKPVEKMEEEK